NLLGHLNRLLAADLEGTRFMTMHLSLVDSVDASFRWVSAGHDPALLFDSKSNQFRELEGADLPLGVMDNTEYQEHSFTPLQPGMVIMIGTDGVWEMPNSVGEQFGKPRVREAIQSAAAGTASEIVKAILDRLTAFRGDCAPVDDVTFVIVKVTATH